MHVRSSLRHGPPIAPKSVFSSPEKQTNHVTPQSMFDTIIKRAKSTSIIEAMEYCLPDMFNAFDSTFWLYFSEKDVFYSSIYTDGVSSKSGMLAAAKNHSKPMIVPQMSSHPSYDLHIDSKRTPPNASSMYIPLYSKSSRLLGIVHLSRRPPSKPFSSADAALAFILQKKFSIYSNFLFPAPYLLSSLAEMVAPAPYPLITGNITTALEKLFSARKAEVWLLNPVKKIIFLLDPEKDKPDIVDHTSSGVIGQVLFNCTKVLSSTVKTLLGYSPEIDGPNDEPIVAIPYLDRQNRTWAVALRGRVIPKPFTDVDSSNLNHAMPFIVNTISSSMSPPQFEARHDDFEKRLSGLLEVAENISGMLDLDILIPTIMEKACELLNSERCSLFLVDSQKQELITRFHGGLSSEIRMPIGRGLVGQTATTGKILLIDDVYNNDQFDRTWDLKTGFKTKSILCVPIYNNSGEIAGVTEMINKQHGWTFTNEDVRLLMAFNVFCGISLDNARLYNASIGLSKQLRTFTDLSSALVHSGAARNVLQRILENAISTANATRGSLYICNTMDNSLAQIASSGPSSSYGNKYALEVLTNSGPKTFSTGNEDQPRVGRISDYIQRDSSFSEPQAIRQSPEENILCIPLLNGGGKNLGVLEIESNSKIRVEDIKLLECFAAFAAVSIERSHLIDLLKLGGIEFEIKQALTPEERISTSVVPKSLEIDDDVIWRIDFDAQKWDGIGHIKVLFAIFKRFGICERYKITNEKLYRFIAEVRDSYKSVPYHNWRHAVDVTQFVTYQLLKSGLHEKLTHIELFALIIASICHDANHDGFTNVYNVKAETPLGILFKNQSVMEIHHCQTSIGIISKEECNIFEHLSPTEYKLMWTTFFSLVLSTDMAKHFDILKQMEASTSLDYNDSSIRLLLMQLVLKCADISNVSRPFEIADRWCDVLCEEFFRQGDLEMANGMEYTSPLNDRAHLDKPKSQIGFYTFVCLPLFQATAKAISPLTVNVEQVLSNLAVWKSSSEQK